jgi:N-acetylmuramoyl-L-alanine amidase
MLIAGNAGHCPGLDPGCSGSRITEAELAKQYVEKINGYLEAVGIETIFIQENELWDICNIANRNNVDLFYSLHFNAFNHVATGTETLYCAGSSKGKIFAQCVQDQLVNTLGLVNRGLKTDGLYVTRNTDAPAILIEVGFLDNPHDEAVLVDRMDDACRAVARGITDAIQKLWPSASEPPSAPAPTQSNSKMASKYFSYDEVTCHCCGRHGATPELLKFLDDVREATGGPLEISCAYRCPKHNAETPGSVPNSTHVRGLAADILINDRVDVDTLARICFEQGADACGYYYEDGFVHADIRNGRWSGSHITW